ncbi:flagellar hook-associated protein 2 [Oceanobacillus massiliensis]|uniref:flagellar hook-associated protein 2 n=1 Tax=Oceanobacillus massiliensis TaxID=1465765 RepID=UPI000318850E|nr:flagellar hook-associated protein 2 [Oceanobacillus massiliensis]
MSMRIGGLASGIDTDSIIKDLMNAERIPLDKMSQDKTKLEWQRDAFRDINKKLLELDNMFLDMKMSSTYNSKTVSSTMESAVTAQGSASSSNGTYNINVESLATSAINVSSSEIDGLDPDTSLSEQGITGPIKFTTYDDKGDPQDFSYDLQPGDTLKDVISAINTADNNVRMTYDENTKKVLMETTRTGKYNTEGTNEIEFDEASGFFAAIKMTQVNENGGTNAKFTYNNNYTVESKDNNYTLNGITFQFNNTTGGQNATLTVNNDADASFDKIMAFVDKYNQVVEELNGSQQEERYRDYPPLTDAQKADMSEDEIKLWEEKAKSGLLKGESAISSGLFDMRQSWYSTVDTSSSGGAFSSLTEIGITTSSDYLDGGKLIVSEEKLKAALQDDPESVQKLFSNSSTGTDRGLVNKLEDAVESTMNRINQRAGKGTDTLENYTLGKRMKDLDSRIDAFEDRLVQIEDRYWRQFGAMEEAISMMNQQSSMLMSNFAQ